MISNMISPSAAPAAAAASLRRFLVSLALILLSLIRLRLILSASAMDTIRGRPLPKRHIQIITSKILLPLPRSRCVSAEALRP